MSQSFDYDLAIVGAGVGGHGAALHAVSCGLKTAIIEAADMGEPALTVAVSPRRRYLLLLEECGSYAMLTISSRWVFKLITFDLKEMI